MDILERLRHWSRHVPERPADVSSGRILTYRDLERSSNALAASLSASLPDDHTPVAVIGHKEPELLVAFLAAAKSGHPYIPIDTSIPEARIEAIIKRSRATYQLTPDRIREFLDETTATVPAFPPRQDPAG